VSFRDILYTTTGAFGWVIIGLALVALVYVMAGYLRQARAILRDGGWPALWQHIRRHVLTRRPRNRP